jgi:putative FmdB family regulatory protein
MPTYEYYCQKCGYEFEARQSMKDDAFKDCLQQGCGGAVKRKISLGSGLIFKGSGFYITDYRKDSYKADAKKDSASSCKTGGSGTCASCPTS